VGGGPSLFIFTFLYHNAAYHMLQTPMFASKRRIFQSFPPSSTYPRVNLSPEFQERVYSRSGADDRECAGAEHVYDFKSLWQRTSRGSPRHYVSAKDYLNGVIYFGLCLWHMRLCIGN
jgi:hypothetical protein